MTPAGLDVTIITGMSGAGRSEAANVLEDLGFFVIDNLPPALISKVAELARGADRPSRYALVVDVRAGQFVGELATALAELRSSGARTRVLFLDASDEALVRRYESTRRKHPLSPDRVSDGIARERAVLGELKGSADIELDTSSLNVHELRERLLGIFADEGVPQSGPRVNVVSFGYKHGLPLDVDVVLDCRFLPNPHWVDELRPLTGRDAPVRDYVLGLPETVEFLDRVEDLFAVLLPAYAREGKSYVSIGIGCTGGRHRSVVVAEELAARLAGRGADPRVHHRDADRT